MQVLSLGADCVATGHYARLERGADGRTSLLQAVDHTKDQSYFLATVRQESLQRACFPLGHLLKTDVRALAAAGGLHHVARGALRLQSRRRRARPRQWR